MWITDPHVTTYIGEHVKDNAAFPVGDYNSCADDGNDDDKVNKENRMTSISVKFYQIWKNMLDMKGELVLLQLYVSGVPSHVLQKT